MLTKIQDSLAEKNISRRSFNLKDKLNSFLNLDFSVGNKKGYTYSSDEYKVRNKTLEYRKVSINLDFNKICLQYVSCLTCGDYLEAESSEMFHRNILCDCEINIHFQQTRTLERIHYKIQMELQLIEQAQKEASIVRFL